MDGSHFDALTRTLTARLSRRVTLGGLATGLLLAVSLGRDETTVLAKKKKKKGKKKNNKKKQNCFDLIRCGDECCARSESCCGNHCCLPFQTCCGTGCCSGEESCRDGVCVNHCNDGVQNFRETDTDCGGSCRNVRKCGVPQACGEDADCETDVCVNRPGFGLVCLPCRTDSDCARQNAQTPFCFDNFCADCRTSEDCPADKRCNLQTHSCQECVSDGDCGNAERPFCVAPLDGECRIAGEELPCVCRRCRTSDDCFAEEVCDETGTCVECLSDTDCAAGKVCVQNTCRTPAVCPAGADLCAQGFGSTTACGGNSGCRCHTTTDAETRCVGGSLESRCDAQPACTSRAECEERHGPGAFCVQDTGNFCGCAHCALQCTV